jgi:hypothetical protein
MAELDDAVASLEDGDSPVQPVPRATPAIFQHCCTVYDKMLETATLSEYEGQAVMMWEGFTTKVFDGLHLSVPYYSSVLKALKAMGSMIQLQRGGGGSKSKWALISRPTEDAFNAYFKTGATGNKKAQDDQWKQSMTQMLNDLRKRIDQLERRLAV